MKDIWRTIRSNPFLLIVVSIYVFLLGLTVASHNFTGRFQFFYLLLCGAYFVILASLYNSRFLKLASGSKMMVVVLLIATLALMVRLPFLASNHVLSEDIFRLQARVDWLLSGYLPYKEFITRKPPMYLLSLGLLGSLFDSRIIGFRIAFVIFDTIVALLILFIPKLKDKNGRFGLFAAIGYALCPLVIVESSLASHYEPLVMMTVLIGFIFALRNKGLFSGFLIGIGAGLKLFPIFFLPLLFLKLKGKTQRSFLLLGFFLGFGLGFLPFLLAGNYGVLHYLEEQSLHDYTYCSFLNTLIYRFNGYLPPSVIRKIFLVLTLSFMAGSVLSIKFRKELGRYWVFIIAFLWVSQLTIVQMGFVNNNWIDNSPISKLRILFILISTISLVVFSVLYAKKYVLFEDRYRKFFKIGSTLIFINFAFPVLFFISKLSGFDQNVRHWVLVLGLFIFVCLVGAIIFQFIVHKHQLTEPKEKGTEVEKDDQNTSSIKEWLTPSAVMKVFELQPIEFRTLMFLSFAVMTFLLFFSNQFHPWYLLWLLPFLLLSEDRELMVIFLPMIVIIPSIFYSARDFPPIYGIPKDVLEGLKVFIFSFN